MEWKIFLKYYLGGLLTFSVYFISALYSGNVFDKSGDIYKAKLILHCFILLLCFIVATVGASLELTKEKKELISKEEEPIIITPDKISLRTKEWKEISTFNVYNRSDKILYNIYVKIQIETPQISAQTIDVFPQNDNDKLVVSSKDISITYDNLFIKGTDSKGKGSIYLLIYSLDPKESRAFTINTIPLVDSTTEQINVLVKLSKYSEKSARILEKPEKGVFIQFSLPENFKITGIKQRVKANTLPAELSQKLLRVLTKEEFDLFEKLAENRTFIANDPGQLFILLSDNFFKVSMGMRRGDIELLEQIGLIANQQIKIVKGSTLIGRYRGWRVSWDDDQDRVVAVLSFTRFGRELAILVQPKCDNNYIDNVISLLNANKMDVQLLAISDFQGGAFRYDDMGFCPYKQSEQTTNNINEK